MRWQTLLFAFVAGCFAFGSVQAQDFTFRASDEEVSYNPEDGNAEFTIELLISEEVDGSATETHGFSFAFAYDDSLVDPVAAVAVGDAASLNSGTGPEFYAADLEVTDETGTGMSVGAIYTFDASEVITFATESAVVEVDFETVSSGLVGDLDGTASVLDFRSIGTPAAENLVALALAVEVAPSVDDGIVSFTPQLPFEYTIWPPEAGLATYDANDGTGSFSVQLAIEEVGASNVENALHVNGFSASFSYEDDMVTAVAVTAADELMELNGGDGPAFWITNLAATAGSDTGVTIVAVYDLTGPDFDSVFYTELATVATIDFETVPAALIGDSAGQEIDFDFMPLGSPLVVENVVSAEEGGYRPATVDARFGLHPQIFTFSFDAPSTVKYHYSDGEGSFSVGVQVLEDTAAHPNSPIEANGMSVAFSYDADAIAATAADWGGSLDNLNDGAGPEFWASDLDATDGTTVGVTIGAIFDYAATDTVMFDTMKTVAEVDFDLNTTEFTDNTAGLITELAFSDIGDPAVSNFIADIAATEYQVSTVDANVLITPAVFTFFFDLPAVVAYDPADGEAAFGVGVEIRENFDESPDFPIAANGLSIAFTYDDSLITASDAVAMGELAASNGGDGPDFWATGINGGEVTIGAIIDYSIVDTVEFDTKKRVARVDFDSNPAEFTGNEGGDTATLEFGSVGNPPITNFVADAAAEEYGADYRDGSVLLSPAVFTFRIASAPTGNAYDEATGAGSFAVDLRVVENDDTAATIANGFSMAFSYDDTLLTAAAADFVGELVAMNAGDGPDFWGVSLASVDGDDTGVTIGAIFDYDVTDTMTFSKEKSVASVHFDTVAAALMGDTDGEVTELNFRDFGDPPVVNIVAGTDLEEYQVITVDEAIVLSPAYFSFEVAVAGQEDTDSPCVDDDFDATLSILEAADSPTATTGVTGFSMALTYDATMVSANTAVADGTEMAALNGGTGPSFFGVSLAETAIGGQTAVTIGTVFDTSFPFETIEFDTAKDVATVSFSLLADDAVSTDLGFGAASSPVIDNYVTDSNLEEIVAKGSTLTVTVNDCDGGGDANSFLRGDADDNGQVFPILDALYILEYGFTNGPVPPCLDAADCDGNDVVFPILDALYLLEYGFTNGPAPPDPGPTTCGTDPGDTDSVDPEDGVTCLDTDCP